MAQAEMGAADHLCTPKGVQKPNIYKTEESAPVLTST